MAIDPATDPILSLARDEAPMESFRAAIASAVARNPGLDESIAQAEEAEGARNEARARQLPNATLTFSHFDIVSRAFSDDPLNILERSRPRTRTDALANVQQTLLDFGAGRARARAAAARLEAAMLAAQDTGTQLALRAISAWYNVFAYRALTALASDFVSQENGYRAELERRVAQGYSARADLAQIDGYIAATEAQLADYRRSLANAEAQYVELIGTPPPRLARAPAVAITIASAERARAEAERLPNVRATRAQVDAATQDAKGARADLLPVVTADVDAGRYGVFETDRDYDIRTSATLTWRLFGGARQRSEQADARERGADARYRRVREEAERDAAIAFSDVQALAAAEKAIGENYLAARRSRDVLAERFRVSHGTLFDLINANSNYFSVAARYLLTLTELDTARYALLARTGKLLDALGIPAPLLSR